MSTSVSPLALAYALLPILKAEWIRARLASFVWFRPHRKPPTDAYAVLCKASEVRRPHGAHGGLLRTWGKGTTGVCVHLVHGWGGRWDQFAALIEACVDAGHVVVAQDFVGHGESGGESSDLALWMSDLVRQPCADARHHVFICHSLGLAPLARTVLDGKISPAAVIAVNPPTRFDFLIASFLRKCRLPPGLASRLEHRVRARVPDARGIGDIDVVALADKVPLLYVADRSDREVPFSEHAIAEAHLGPRFFTTRGLGHNRILASPVLCDTIIQYVGRVGAVQPLAAE